MTAAARTLAVLAQALVLVAALDRPRRDTVVAMNANNSVMDSLWKSFDASDNIWVRPDLGPTTVNVTLGIRSVVVDEVQSTMVVSAWLKQEWRDSKKTWNETTNPDFKPIKALHLSKQHIWHPDIVLKNSWAGKAADLLDGASATLFPDGRIVWRPSAVFESYCELDMNRWPFERHVCHLRLGSWTLSNRELQIGSIKHEIEFPGQIGEFVVEQVVETYEKALEDGVADPFDVVLYTIALQREAGYYRAIIFAPAAVVVILCLSAFLLPPRAGEKIVLGGVNAILICMFLIYFAHSMPMLTDQTPLIVVFYSTSLYLVCLSLSVTVLVLNISRHSHSAGLPWTVKRILTGSFGRALLLSSYIEQIMGVDHGPCARRPPTSSSGSQDEIPVVMHDEMEPEGLAGCSAEIASKAVRPDHEWLLLAAAIDRLVFVIYSLIFLVLAVAFSI